MQYTFERRNQLGVGREEKRDILGMVRENFENLKITYYALFEVCRLCNNTWLMG